ncbi:MAG TPA: M23 family metallopeptidase [Clostridia bacterium]|nr:M23 family metallopeptidase [Clostridia bacterium]
MLSMRSLEMPCSEQMVLSVQNILNKEMDFDEMLGKLQFVELPNVLEVFAADKKMAVPVNADNVKIAHDEGYIEWEESPDAQVIAAANGRVRAIGVDDLLGNYIRLEHDGELETIYYGLNSIQVEEGQPIRKLDSLGTLGSSGFLRLYVLYAGKPQPPENYFELKLNK